jgi:hypothetical protein
MEKMMMYDDFENVEEHVLRLSFLERSKASAAKVIERPLCEEIAKAIDLVYIDGGYVRLRVLKPDNSYISLLEMCSLPKQFRIIVLNNEGYNEECPKSNLFEWWEPGDTAFRGKIRFGDDEWDARTVASDVSIAHKIFRELYDCGKLSSETWSNLRPG